jgi:hypothetical protein
MRVRVSPPAPNMNKKYNERNVEYVNLCMNLMSTLIAYHRFDTNKRLVDEAKEALLNFLEDELKEICEEE